MTETINFRINWQIKQDLPHTLVQLELPPVPIKKKGWWGKRQAVSSAPVQVQRQLSPSLKLEIKHFYPRENAHCLHQNLYLKNLFTEEGQNKIFFYCCECGHEEKLTLVGLNPNWVDKLVLGFQSQETEIDLVNKLGNQLRP